MNAPNQVACLPDEIIILGLYFIAVINKAMKMFCSGQENLNPSVIYTNKIHVFF